MKSLPTFDSGPAQVMVASGDAVVVTLTGVAQDVLPAAFSEPNVVEFWAEEDFHGTFGKVADAPTADTGDYLFLANTVYHRVIPQGRQMSVLGLTGGGKLYLAY